MLTWLWKLWRARQRKFDMKILWPACVAQATDLDHAKAAFAVHAFNDPAWTDDYSHDQIVELLDALPSSNRRVGGPS